jgi:uncharacterized SAM-binding protein YcdF (DUF218 family)
MFFLLSKIVWFILTPFNLALFALTGAMLAMYIKRHKLARTLGITSWAILMIFAVLPTGQLMIRPLESRYPVPTEIERPVKGIIVLGGTMYPDIGLSRGAPQLMSTADRLTAFADLGRKYPWAKLVFTSGQGSVAQDGIPEAAMIRDMLGIMGFYPNKRLIIEDRARNTWENAKFSKRLVNPKPGERWILVTSASHMPRAVGVFRKLGWDVIPYPTDYFTAGKGGKTGSSYITNMLMAQAALKEYIGIAVYSLTDKWKAENNVQPSR